MKDDSAIFYERGRSRNCRLRVGVGLWFVRSGLDLV